ncbi:MAG: rhomboid family intramembrane serine protease [Flavobacteriales bacterium]|nr:rhomboid family intramembrane serine protease [Flavobacteriales bacterium]
MVITEIIVAATAFTSIAAFNSPKLLNDWIFDPYTMFRNRQYYRFLTSGLLHGGWLHLIINMFVLYSFGQAVEYYYASVFGSNSTWFFMLLYAGGLVVSDLPTFYKHKDNVAYRGLGASGAVSAVVFASIIFNPMGSIYLYFFIEMPAIVLGIVYLAYSWYMSRNSTDNINHDAHFYGAVFGFLFTLVLEPGLLGEFLHQLPF